MRTFAFFILLALCLSSLAMARTSPLSPALHPAGIREQHLEEKSIGVAAILPGTFQLRGGHATNTAAVATHPSKRSFAKKKRATRSRRVEKETANKNMQVYQADYAAARTHPPTEPP